MAMAISGKACVHTILMVCLALASCEAKFVRRSEADTFGHGNLARNIARRNEKVFNVLQFGAKPGGKSDCTMNFMRAWRAACDFKGNSRLLIPGGVFLLSQIVFAGPCSGPGPIIVQVVGTLKATTDPSEYVSPEWILFESVTGLVVTGSGTLNGQGEFDWKY